MQRIVDGETQKEEKEKFRRRFYEETKIKEMMRQMNNFYQNKVEKKLSDDSPVKAKLRKLVISKFTALYWFLFWNQFKSETERQDIIPVTTFSYLKEFLFLFYLSLWPNWWPSIQK